MLEDILVPIFVCCVLPVSIVLIIYLAYINADNKRAQVLIKAIESGNVMDTDKLAEALKKPQKSAREILNLRLLRGCIFSLIGVSIIVTSLFIDMPKAILVGALSLAIGLSYLIVWFVSRKHVGDKE